MTELLIKIFIKDGNNVTDARVRAKYGAFAGAVGIITNILIAAAKLFVGLIVGSISIVADAVNNFSDAGSSLITMVGFRLSGRPADRGHPYGHARYEYLTGLLVSVVVVFLGGTFMIESVKKIISGERSQIEGWIMFVILGVSILVKLWQCLFYLKISKRIRSESLKASAADSRNDCIMTAVVLVGAVVGSIWDIAVDGWFGVAVALFILISGVRMIIDTANPLIGQAPDAELIRALKEKILSYDKVVGLHDMMIHSYGANRVFCSVHVEVPADEDVMECHDIVDNIEEDVFNQMGIFLVIHSDPVTLGDSRIDKIHDLLTRIIEEKQPGCKFHDLRVVFGPTHDNVLFDVVVPFDCTESHEEIVSKIKNAVRAEYPKAVLKIRIENDYTGE